MTTLPAVVRIVDLPTGTAITGLEVIEAVQTVSGQQISVQLPLNQIVTTILGALPTGGGTSQILAKSSNSNFSAAWYDIASFISVIATTGLATSGSGTGLVIAIASAGIGSTQIATGAVGSTQLAANAVQSSNVTTNAIGNAQFRQGSPLSVVGVAGNATANVADIVGTANQVLQVNAGGTGLIFGAPAVQTAFSGITNTGLFSQSGTTLATGTFGVVGTTLVTGVIGAVGTATFTGVHNIVGTTIITGTMGVSGTATFAVAPVFSDAPGSRTNMGAFGVLRVQIFTTSGTYTPNTRMVSCLVECLGGGAGGGAAVGTTGFIIAGSGGGSGGYSRSWLSSTTIGTSQTVTIGANGTGGAAGLNSGTSGGSTSLGTLVIAKGGLLGNAMSSASLQPASLAAVAGTGDVAIGGMAGGQGIYFGFTNGNAAGGAGGSSVYGAGGPALINTNSSGSIAGGFGGGGGGGLVTNSTASTAGGNGTPGLCIIWEFCTQ